MSGTAMRDYLSVLFVGGTERLSDHRSVGFELLQPFFYRKPD